MIKSLSIEGFRGFGKKQMIKFAASNGKIGSGITFLVGPNNSGKTTILEALRLFNFTEHNYPSISEGKRNHNKGGKVIVTIINDLSERFTIKNEKSESGLMSFYKNDELFKEEINFGIFVLPSRRHINSEFALTDYSRENYVRFSQHSYKNREPGLNDFYQRISKIYVNSERYNEDLKKVLGTDFAWTIDQNDNGMFYMKYQVGKSFHNSEGVGDGIWSVFTICDALYDSEEGSLIAIDEPELSLHPVLQKRVLNLLKEYSKTRQIVISTHSPYFIDWESIINGAEFIRAIKNNYYKIEINQLDDDTKRLLSAFLCDLDQPHTLGLDAKEVFFLEDDVILVEGQEDAVIFPKIAKQMGLTIIGNIFGWGVGGAGKMETIIKIFQNLGYKKVKIIFDGDKKKEKDYLEKIYSDYDFFLLPADDIRDKKCQIREGKKGIVDSKGLIKEEFKEAMRTLINQINES